MKRFCLSILVLLLFFSSATVFVNICGAFRAEKCHSDFFDECYLKSAFTDVESGKILASVPEDVNCAFNFTSELTENRVKFIPNTDLSHLLDDYSCVVRYANPSNAPPQA